MIGFSISKEEARGGFYYIYYPHPVTGKRTKITTGTRNSVKAHEFFRKFKKRYEVNSIGIKSIPIPEFAVMIKTFKQTYTVKTVSSAYEFILNELDEFLEGKVNLDKLTQKNVNDYLSYLTSKNLAKGTINRKIIMLKVAINYAKENGYFPEDTNITIKPIKIPKVRRKFLVKEKFQQLLSNCQCKDLYDIINMAFMTGMREAELIHLTWREVDLEEKTIVLDNQTHKTKNGEIRTVLLNSDAIDVIRERLINKHDNYVFTYNSKRWVVDTLIKKFTALVQQTFGEKSGITFHTLRRSFATNLNREGTSGFSIMELMGHANYSTTQIYIQPTHGTLRGDVEKLSIKNSKPEFSKN